MVQVQNLSFTYPDGRQALQGIELAIAAGEKVGLVGDNGAGKSTLLLHLNGILRGKGSLYVDGLELREDTLRAIRARVGLVFQDPDDQLFSPTVFDDVAFGPLNMGLPESEVRERTAWALEQVGMADYAQRMPHHLSLGEKKRVAIATVLSMQPAILALDEPSAGLDPRARASLMALLQGLPQTMLIASHDLEFVQELCCRAVVLDRGRVMADMPLDGCDIAAIYLRQQAAGSGSWPRDSRD
ncbi:MAG: ABC transporter ATP-binding protein [Chloroflexi bacterium]|nr:ABC transporter ATP-binding protein [Chloroflexota bacterium]